MQENEQDKQPKTPQEQPETGQAPDKLPNLWQLLQDRGYKIEEITPKTYRLTGGAHYYVLDPTYPRSIICTTCEVKHGGILEAHKLTSYRLENGILYYQDQPLNTPPDTV